jgi:hypothetical protein
MYAPPEQLLNQPCGPPAGVCTHAFVRAVPGLLVRHFACMRSAGRASHARRVAAACLSELSMFTTWLHMTASCLPACLPACLQTSLL